MPAKVNSFVAVLEREVEGWKMKAARSVVGSPEYFLAWGQVDGLRRAIQLFYLEAMKDLP
jgi:hypothetical protein